MYQRARTFERRRTTRGKRAGVLNRLECSVQWIRVDLDGASGGVTDRKHDIDIGQSAGEYPVCRIETAGIEYLNDHLYVARAEEREIAGISREAHGLALSALAVAGAPCRSDGKTIAIQADRC